MSTMEIRREAIKALEDSEGRTTADRLVQAAGNPDHPMHPDFEWDDAVAGHLHRLDTARRIMASLTDIITNGSKRISAPAYVRDPDAPEGEQGDSRDSLIGCAMLLPRSISPMSLMRSLKQQ